MSGVPVPAAWPQDLRRLAEVALGNGELGATQRALRALKAVPESDRGRPFTLGLCSTFVIAPQLPLLQLSLAADGLAPLLVPGELDNIEQALFDPAGPVLAAAPDAVVVLWRLDELAPQLVAEGAILGRAARRAIIDGIVDRVRGVARGAQGRAPLFLSTIPVPPVAGSALVDLHGGAGLAAAAAEVNAALFELAAESERVHILDLAGWAVQVGAGAFSEKMDLFARQPIAAGAALSFVRLVIDSLRPLYRPRAKVLALDLDNTLWGGILGEDGLGGLKIGHEFPGNAYRRIQAHAKALKAQGVLLALLSKNNLSDVEEAFAGLPDMPLALSDFSAIRANWEPKHSNLRAIMAELNLGLDSAVFLDDQAFEREQMAYSLPEVTVLPASEDPLITLLALRAYRGFDALRLSREDLGRAAAYEGQRQREVMRESSGSLEDFLHSLRLKAELAPVAQASLGRVVQMLSKTNQFNLTTRRHGEARVAEMVTQPGAVHFTVALADRFGDQGIIGLLLALPSAEAEGALEVDSFLLSCRALGRGVEALMWSALLDGAVARGFTAVTARYIPTAKNAQVADLYDRLGMIACGKDGEAMCYRLDLPAAATIPGWLSVTVAGALNGS